MHYLALETRTGLPDALRVLVKRCPRETWEKSANFSGLVRFGLGRHAVFRKLQALLCEDAETLIDGNIAPQRYAARLVRYGSILVGEIVGHHNVEDAHYFPLLARTESSVARGFAILDRDHQALDEHLDAFVARARAVLSRVEASDLRDRVGLLHADVARFGDLLERHLVDEEDLVVPVILKHGPEGLG